MATFAYIAGHSDVQLWSLDSHERISRQLRQIGGVNLVDDPTIVPGDAQLLLLRADYLFEVRTLRELLNHSDSAMMHASDARPVAAFVDAANIESVLAAMVEGAALPAMIETVSPADLSLFDHQLRKAKPPLLEPLDDSNRKILEAQLYGGAYKGITDLVTKFWLPRPARYGVRVCARFDIAPNTVTAVGIFLMVLACYLFANGQFALGLIAGWIMSYLDTVDGKLARVTVLSTRLGHLLDHGMDLLHPPFWYIYWGTALASVPDVWGLALPQWNLLIIVGYVGGRLAEMLFHQLGSCSIFSWRPIDAYFRLITARRNPCLILLTLGVCIGRPGWGFAAVAIWTAATSSILVLRLMHGLVVRLRHGPLESWLSEPVRSAREHARAYSTFSSTRGAYAAD
jgi:phosphatidylglycerophosphate synthase